MCFFLNQNKTGEVKKFSQTEPKMQCLIIYALFASISGSEGRFVFVKDAPIDPLQIMIRIMKT